MYDMVCRRPNIAYEMSLISMYMANPGAYWQAFKWILIYIKGSLSRVLVYGGAISDGEAKFKGFIDSDYARCIGTRKLLSRYVFTMFGTTISWKVSLQMVFSLSTVEAEYISLTKDVNEALWLEEFVEELKLKVQAITIKHDSQNAIHLSKNSAYHERAKHIDVRPHFIRGKNRKWRSQSDEGFDRSQCCRYDHHVITK